jgi:hypothetical protein
MLILSLFIAIKSSFLYTYYERLGTLSLYYLYAALFGISTSIVQILHIFIHIVDIPQEIAFVDFVTTIMIRINFLIFMYLLWKRPHRISLLKIGLFTLVGLLIAFSIPVLEYSSQSLNVANSSFRLLYFPLFAFGCLLLLSIMYYFWKIAHFKNGLSIVVMISLLPFLIGVLMAALFEMPADQHSPYNYILYTIAMIPLPIKLMIEGFDGGREYINGNNINGTRK